MKQNIAFIFLASSLLSSSINAEPFLINGKPVEEQGDSFDGVGTFNSGCTITKVGARQFITAAHCVPRSLSSISLQYKKFLGNVKVSSLHVHPSWLKDCATYRCTGTEVGTSRMTPGRADVALINVGIDTPKIPIINIRFSPFADGTEVAMVGAGCTRNIEPNGSGKMRYAITRTISWSNLIHEHSLYRTIAEITGMSDWVTPGYGVSNQNASLCPGDSGGPLLTKNTQGAWEIAGIAADYTFNGPYRDGAVTVTNLHTRLDDQSLHQIGAWIRNVWGEEVTE